MTVIIAGCKDSVDGLTIPTSGATEMYYKMLLKFEEQKKATQRFLNK